ncbi:3-deoxy-D-manno-octulosonic acid kinase [Dokdonella soli]|uniref:3-deoxy-D-manno-octulosonic acid kinase n=1 Tax=Dokdonella soli TaxID=529810 RepID=A0ABN1IRP4_9GAMM
MIEAQVQSTATGAIVFDRALGIAPDDAWFDRARASGAAAAVPSGGRGGVAFVDTPAGECALRHYHRGGFAARISADRYLWTGAARTRAFREFHLLAKLAGAGLPVPAPVVARYVRDGLYYRADLMTRRIESSHTLAERLAVGALGLALALRVGRTIARFHASGVWHADLNAHNILVDVADAVWLIDFDRGRMRKPKLAWQQANIARLRRSFEKLGARRVGDFDAQFWHPLLAAYHSALSQDPPAAHVDGALS